MLRKNLRYNYITKDGHIRVLSLCCERIYVTTTSLKMVKLEYFHYNENLRYNHITKSGQMSFGDVVITQIPSQYSESTLI